MRLGLLLACGLAAASAAALDCNAETVPVADLEEGQYLAVTVAGIRYGIFKRRISQSRALRAGGARTGEASGNTNRPPDWWPNADMPPSVSPWASGVLRSRDPQLFVFYALAPAGTQDGACHVIHYPRHRRASFPAPNFYNALGADWSGGFVAPCTGVAYDYAGRPVSAASLPADPQRGWSGRYELVVPEYELAASGRTLRVCR